MAREVPRYCSLSCGGSALGVRTSSGCVYMYGSLCDGKDTPTQVCGNMPARVRCTRFFNSCLYFGLLDEEDEFYFAPHWLGGDVTHIPRENFGGSAILSIAFGAAHALLLASDNTLFVCGHKNSPAMGGGDKVHGGVFENVYNHNRPDYTKYELRKIRQDTLGEWGTICGIICAQGICGFWTQREVWLWGVEASALLALDEYAHYASTIHEIEKKYRGRYHRWPSAHKPTKVKHLDLKGTCRGVSIGLTHAAVVDSEGTGALWGGNQYGQLATNDTTYRYRPCLVDRACMQKQGMQSIKTSKAHTTFLTTTGDVWVVGRLGTQQNCKPTLLPRSVFGGAAIREIDASMHYIAAVNDRGLVYTWGMKLSETEGVLKLPAECTGFQMPVPMQISCAWFGGELVGHWIRRLAFAMATHARLGAWSQARVLLPEILPMILV